MKVRRLGAELKFRAELFGLSLALFSTGIFFALLSADVMVAFAGIGSGTVIGIYLYCF